ncbi:MAG TPA: Xaa-Pro peptidase family protein [Dehalococcoidales bacterium]|nr:Xaa-Pro peptidase family protein [Dehalococcoidales bacterium]
MPISEKEYNRRYAAIRKQMQTDGLDSLLVIGLSDDFNRGNIRYITGSGRGGCCIFPLEGSPVLLTNSILSRSPKFPRTIEAYSLLELVETTNPSEKTIQELSFFDKGQKIGIVGMNCLAAPMYLKIKEKFGDRLIDVAEYFRPLREIKSAEEIEKLCAAAGVADLVFKRLREIIRPGLSEHDIYGEVKKVIYQSGCEYSFDLLDADGSRMNMAFFPTEDRLEENGTLFMEISPSFQGYYAQLPVTLPVGQYQPHVEQMVKAWNQADQSVRKMLHPGTKVSDIYTLLIESIQSNGFLSPLRPGHSVGLDILDFWSIEQTNNTILQPGMVIAVHPCVMVSVGGDGVGMGYTYLITESGFEKLSQIDLARELLR